VGENTKAQATLQDGNPEPGPALYRCPGQRWDEVVFAALLKTEWWMASGGEDEESSGF